MFRFFLPLLLVTSLAVHAQQASYALIHRILPAHASSFIIESLSPSGKDSFELESRGKKIILRGNTGVAVASALYYYLKNFCHCQITWNGTNLRLPTHLPAIKTKIAVSSPYKDRYDLN